jgi:deoxyribodipyrimidine photo-lyase
VSGTGAETAPFFRIFNPVLQSEKFDKNGEYIKKWIPELKNIPSKYIHTPHKIPKNILEQINFKIGEDYPIPIGNI